MVYNPLNNMKRRFSSSGFGKNFKRPEKKRVRGIIGKAVK